jgi:hypothetical protein
MFIINDLAIGTFVSFLETCGILPVMTPSGMIKLSEHVSIRISCRNNSVLENSSRIYILEPHHLNVASIDIKIHTISDMNITPRYELLS